MSLLSSNIPEEFREGRVYLRDDGSSKMSFANFLVLNMRRDITKTMDIFKYLLSHDKKFIPNSTPVHPVVLSQCIMDYVATELSCSPADVVLYILLAERYDDSFKPAVINIPSKRFKVIYTIRGMCLIATTEEDVQITVVDESRKTKSTPSAHLQQILRSRMGYSTGFVNNKLSMPFKDALDFETVKLNNYSIYTSLAEAYPEIQELNIPVDKEMHESLCLYFNDRIVSTLSKKHNADFSSIPCLWVHDVNDFVDGMNTPVYEVSFSGDMYPIYDMASSGCLIAASDIHTKKLHVENKTCTKTSIFSDHFDRGEAKTVEGIPTWEMGHLCFAVTYESYINLHGKEPDVGHKSCEYYELYLTEHIPYVGLWNTLPTPSQLYKITFDDFGVVEISYTTIEVKKI